MPREDHYKIDPETSEVTLDTVRADKHAITFTRDPETNEIEIDSIPIPIEFHNLCHDYHSGQNCMMYAVSSTGNLTLGNRRPRATSTDQEWYVSIWQDLSIDVMHAANLVGKEVSKLSKFDDLEPEHEDYLEQAQADYTSLTAFGTWCDEIVDLLMESYGIEEL